MQIYIRKPKRKSQKMLSHAITKKKKQKDSQCTHSKKMNHNRISIVSFILTKNRILMKILLIIIKRITSGTLKWSKIGIIIV